MHTGEYYLLLSYMKHISISTQHINVVQHIAYRSVNVLKIFLKHMRDEVFYSCLKSVYYIYIVCKS